MMSETSLPGGEGGKGRTEREVAKDFIIKISISSDLVSVNRTPSLVYLTILLLKQFICRAKDSERFNLRLIYVFRKTILKNYSTI